MWSVWRPWGFWRKAWQKSLGKKTYHAPWPIPEQVKSVSWKGQMSLKKRANYISTNNKYQDKIILLLVTGLCLWTMFWSFLTEGWNIFYLMQSKTSLQFTVLQINWITYLKPRSKLNLYNRCFMASFHFKPEQTKKDEQKLNFKPHRQKAIRFTTNFAIKTLSLFNSRS